MAEQITPGLPNQALIVGDWMGRVGRIVEDIERIAGGS